MVDRHRARFSPTVLAAVLLLLAAQGGVAQEPIPPPPPPPKSPEPAVKGKELSQKAVDALIATTFARDSAEANGPGLHSRVILHPGRNDTCFLTSGGR